MTLTANLVTVHPYFKTHPGKKDQVRVVLDQFIEKTRSETACLFYEFTAMEDLIFCREGYVGAAGVLEHLENVGETLGEMLTHADLTRLEFHGPAAEIDLLRAPLSHLNASFYVLQCGIER